MEYHIVKRVLTRQYLPPGKVMMLFRLVPPGMGTSVVMGWIPYSSAWCQGHMGSYCYVPSWPVLKIDAI
jgi:hypothetical protein